MQLISTLTGTIFYEGMAYEILAYADKHNIDLTQCIVVGKG